MFEILGYFIQFYIDNYLIIGVIIFLSTVIGMVSSIQYELVCLINVEISLSVGVKQLERMVLSVSG